jgi:hypothetical protein
MLQKGDKESKLYLLERKRCGIWHIKLSRDYCMVPFFMRVPTITQAIWNIWYNLQRH